MRGDHLPVILRRFSKDLSSEITKPTLEIVLGKTKAHSSLLNVSDLHDFHPCVGVTVLEGKEYILLVVINESDIDLFIFSWELVLENAHASLHFEKVSVSVSL